MTHSQTQIILMLVYGFTGTLAFLAPSITADLFARDGGDEERGVASSTFW